MLRVSNLFYQYGKLEVLKDVSFEVEKGKLYALFGPNGTGKTTLFKCIMRVFDIQNRGEIRINNRNILTMKADEIARTVAYVPQEHKPPFPYLVKEVVLMGRTPHMGGVFGPKSEDIKAAIEAMEMVGIIDLADRMYTNLSGGQRQLVLLARAFAQNTDILLLDEPTSNLDFKNQITIWNIVKKITSSGKTAIICSHDPNHVLWYCDQVILLGRDGRILAKGSTKEVLSKEILHQMYGDLCSIKRYDDNAVVFPVHEHIS